MPETTGFNFDNGDTANVRLVGDEWQWTYKNSDGATLGSGVAPSFRDAKEFCDRLAKDRGNTIQGKLGA